MKFRFVITYKPLGCYSLCEQPAHNAFIFRKSHSSAVLISETSFGEIVLFLYIKDKQLADLIGRKPLCFINVINLTLAK